MWSLEVQGRRGPVPTLNLFISFPLDSTSALTSLGKKERQWGGSMRVV